MSVTVMTDVDGETLHLKVNGAGLALDTQTAYFVAHYLTFALNKLARDKPIRSIDTSLKLEFAISALKKFYLLH